MIDKNICYWDGIKPVLSKVYSEMLMEDMQPFLGKYCVDLRFTEPTSRYGSYIDLRWQHIPLSDFPNEFRVALLLLEI